MFDQAWTLSWERHHGVIMKVIWVYLELKIQNVEQQSGAQVFGLCLIGLWGAAALIWVALKERKGKERKGKERKGKDARPNMVSHTWNLCFAFNPSKCTHTQQWEVNKHTHTHTVNTHPEQWAANAAAPGEQLGVRCLAQGSHPWYWRWRERSPHLESLLDLRLKPATFRLQVQLSNH